LTKQEKLKKEIALLRKVQRAVRTEPRRIDMGRWSTRHHPVDVKMDPDLPRCGTTACIAGWLLTLNKLDRLGITLSKAKRSDLDKADNLILQTLHSGHTPGGRHPIVAKAEKLVGVDGMAVFTEERWPEKFRARLEEHENGTQEYADVVVDYIDWLIEEKKAGRDGSHFYF
jgi:hypothetical protein